MKCDELKPLMCANEPNVRPMYDKSEVDDAIAELKAILRDHCMNCPVKEQEDDVVAELKAENAELQQKLDKAIAERDGNQVCIDALKQKLHDAEMRADLAEAANTEYRLDIEKIKAENERLEKELKHSEDELESYFIFEVEIKQKLRATRRALYKALANWAKCEERINNRDAYEASEYLPSAEDKFRKKAERWSEMERKCLKKAEEYK